MGEAVDRDVARLRAATEPFKSSGAAIAEGYPRETDCVQMQPHGAMGYHFGNPALKDATLDVEKPEVLVYEKRQDGTFQLNGVEFYVPFSAWTKAEPPSIMGQNLKRAEGSASGTCTYGAGRRIHPDCSPTGTPTLSVEMTEGGKARADRFVLIACGVFAVLMTALTLGAAAPVGAGIVAIFIALGLAPYGFTALLNLIQPMRRGLIVATTRVVAVIYGLFDCGLRYLALYHPQSSTDAVVVAILYRSGGCRPWWSSPP